jgi:lipoprotein-releasing system permease protein
MFELSVAFKYLRPRWRQLSVSIITLISILVIALVVWLILVFFSVTNGLEKNWIRKLITLTAPVRITPTQAYFDSYYYQIDSLSSASDYSLKSIKEKLRTASADPYDPMIDEEVPVSWPTPLRESEGGIKDLVKTAFQTVQSVKGIPGLTASDFEMTAGDMRLRLLRDSNHDGLLLPPETSQSFISQKAYIGSLDVTNPALSQTLLKPSMADLTNIYRLLAVDSSDIQEDFPETVPLLDDKVTQDKLLAFFGNVHVKALKPPSMGWPFPSILWPSSATFQVFIVTRGERISEVIIPNETKKIPDQLKQLESEGLKVSVGTLKIADKKAFLVNPEGDEKALPLHIPLLIASQISFPAILVESSLSQAKHPRDVKFEISLSLQGHHLKDQISFGWLEIAEADFKDTFAEPPLIPPTWSYRISNGESSQLILPVDKQFGEGILIPRGFRETGVFLGDRGYLSYYTPTASTLQEQRIPVYVSGFYDPGILPIGGKFVVASADLTSLIRTAHHQDETASLSNGINVRFNHIGDADKVKEALQKAFKEAGIAPYWRIETFREFDFTKDILQQMQSDKTLFMLISTVIIIVACSNIISMLIILVNDKKLEIGILRSMGASSLSIAFIFGTCGAVMGLVGSLLGMLTALATLKNLDVLVTLLSKLQGHHAFNPIFYGDSLPNEVSFEALTFVILATLGISLLAGIVPAVKACLLKPSAILRAE